MIYPCIAFDFDHTLAFYKDGYTNLFSIFTDRGIPADVIKSAYSRTKEVGGFSIENLIEVLESVTQYDLNHKEIKSNFNTWLRSSLVLYSDVHGVFKKIKQSGRSISIITRGNSDFQLKKIRLLGIPFDHVYFADGSHEKKDSLVDLISKYGPRIIYIDDRASELDMIRESGLDEKNVHTVRMLRPGGSYNHEKNRFKHTHVESLYDLYDMFLSD